MYFKFIYVGFLQTKQNVLANTLRILTPILKMNYCTSYDLYCNANNTDSNPYHFCVRFTTNIVLDTIHIPTRTIFFSSHIR